MATKRKLKADGATGKVAIYTVEDTAIDDAPFTAPLSNLSRVEFHSDLDYVRVNSVQTGTLNLPSRAKGFPVTARHNLFAHGLGYQPMVMGYAELDSTYTLSLLGSVILYGSNDFFTVGSNPGADGWFRSVQLGADTTYVYLHEYSLLPRSGTTRPDFPAQTLDWTVMVTSRNMDSSTGNDNTASHPSNLYISPSRVVFGRGKFDTDYRHIKKSASGFGVYIDTSVSLYRIGVAIGLAMNADGYVRGNASGTWVAPAATLVKMDAV